MTYKALKRLSPRT